MEYDFFICHASADKEEFVRPLVKSLEARGYRVWFDEKNLLLGDSLSESIDLGLSRSMRGLVVLSPAFFGRPWPEQELSELERRQNSLGEQLIFPVWHEVDHAVVSKYSESLADMVPISSSEGAEAVAKRLAKSIPPQLNGSVEGLRRAEDLADEAKIMRKSGKPREAEKLYLQALELKQDIIGENSMGYATTLGGLGALYRAMSRYEDAERAYTQSISIKRGRLPESATSLAVSLSSYALVRNKMGGDGPQEAESLYDDAIQLKTQEFGRDSVEVAATERRAAELLRPHGKLAKASALAEHALAIQEQAGVPGRRIARTLRILSKIRRDQGANKEADSYAERAMLMRREDDDLSDEGDAD